MTALRTTVPLPVAARELWDVVVIGAGPAGAFLAWNLARQSLRVLLVDKHEFPRDKVCGCCVGSLGLSLLAATGCLTATPQTEFDQLQIRGFSQSATLSIPPGKVIDRSQLDAHLVEAAVAAGAEFLSGVRATVGPIEDGRRVVELAASRELAGRVLARVVVAADGLGSPSVRGAGLFPRHLPAVSRIGASCRLPANATETPAGQIRMIVGDGGYVGFARLPTGEWNVAAALDATAIASHGGVGPLVRHLLSRADIAVDHWPDSDAWRTTPKLRQSHHQFAAERIFLVGDAAGYVEPFTGEGISMALLGAQCLAPLVVEGVREWQPRLVPAWNRTYSRQVQARQTTCWMLARILEHPWLAKWTLRTAGVWPAFFERLARRLGRLPASVVGETRDSPNQPRMMAS